MSAADRGYDEIRLEETDGTVIAHFAPSFEVVPKDNNDVHQSGRGDDRPAIARDLGLWTSELTVQGTFHHSDSLFPAFRTELQSLFGQSTVTPDDQVDRLRNHTTYGDPGSVHFYHRDREYTAMGSGDLDVGNGVYPAVSVAELRTPEEGETSQDRVDFMVRLAVGLPRG